MSVRTGGLETDCVARVTPARQGSRSRPFRERREPVGVYIVDSEGGEKVLPF